MNNFILGLIPSIITPQNSATSQWLTGTRPSSPTGNTGRLGNQTRTRTQSLDGGFREGGVESFKVKQRVCVNDVERQESFGGVDVVVASRQTE